MNRRSTIAHSILWAAAIIASAILKAPPVLTAVLLPSLATCALMLQPQRPCVDLPPPAGS